MLADDLSRDNLASFWSKVPNADIPPSTTALLDLLLSPEVDWVSRNGRVCSPVFLAGRVCSPVFLAGIAASTRNSYNSGMKRFYAFCERFQIFTPFPVYEHLLCSYVAYLADDGLSPQTAKSYLAAVRNVQLSLGLPDPCEASSLPILKRVLCDLYSSVGGRLRFAYLSQWSC